MSLSSTRARDLMALIAGLLLPLAFAPFNAWPLALLSQALFFTVLLDTSPGRAAWRGYLYGLGMFGAGVWWIQISVHQFGIPLYLFSVSVTILFVLFLSLYPMLVAWLAVRLQQHGWPLLASLPALWLLVEWLRSWLLTGFPWLSLGYSQIDSPLRSMAPLGGVFLVSLVTTGLAALAVACFTAAARRLRWLAAIVVVIAGCLAAGQIRWSEVTGAPLDIALVQGAVPQAVKWKPESLLPTQDLYLELTEGHWNADLIIWPETAIPAFRDRLQRYVERVRQRLYQSQAELLVGLVVREDDGSYYNSIVDMRTDQRYDKYHLVPFGEYLPLRSILEKPLQAMQVPMSRFRARESGTSLFRVGNLMLGASICYEDVFGNESITALPTADVLVNVSNDAWFGDSIAPHQHLQIARMRALESSRWLLRSTNTGITAVIDHHGRITARTPAFEPNVLRTEVQRRSGSTLYVRTGDWLAVGLALALLLVAGWQRQRQN